jgi:hypothetical protein
MVRGAATRQSNTLITLTTCTMVTRISSIAIITMSALDASAQVAMTCALHARASNAHAHRVTIRQPER